MIINFVQYFHDEWEEGAPYSLMKALYDAGFTTEDTEELLQKIGRPFYEVAVECTLDTETGKVEIEPT